MVRGMCGRGHVWQGGVCGKGVCVAGGCAWQEHVWQGACVAGGMHGRGHVWQILQDTVSEQAIRILLECILVNEVINEDVPFTL